MNPSICIAQLNLILGDLDGNVHKIAEAARQAHAAGAGAVLTSELSLCGGDAQDLFLQPAFVRACEDAVQTLARQTAALPGLQLLVGHPIRVGGAGGGLHNGVSLLQDGAVQPLGGKQQLGVDEQRYFQPGPGPVQIAFAGVPATLFMGADLHGPAAAAAQARLLLGMDARDYRGQPQASRDAALLAVAQRRDRPLAWANACGAQAGRVFCGGSLLATADGGLAARASSWAPQLLSVQLETSADGVFTPKISTPESLDPQEDLWRALVLGLRDYVDKNGFRAVALGLSGGMDSALALALAVDALGPERVRALFMPSPYTAGISGEDAHAMARGLGVRCDEISIVPEFEAFKHSLVPLFEGRPEDTTEENLQARIRGMLLMGLSNKLGHLVLAPGNKSELAVGYSTLYGDMCGGYAPIKDLYKTQVYELARWRNAHDPLGTGAQPIPQRIIDRPPSAELRADQTDQDSLPPYDVLDGILAAHLEHGASVAELQAQGYDPATARRVLRLLRINEYKRRQSAVGTMVSRHGFNADWRYPIGHGFKE